MTSQCWDAGQAHAYHEFQYHFPEQALARKAIVVAGGTGGWAPPPSHGSRGKALTSVKTAGIMNSGSRRAANARKASAEGTPAPGSAGTR